MSVRGTTGLEESRDSTEGPSGSAEDLKGFFDMVDSESLRVLTGMIDALLVKTKFLDYWCCVGADL